VEHRKIGSLEVSVVGLGCNNFGSRIDADKTADIVSAALDCGITFFDTSDTYGRTRSEEFLGRALGSRRGDVVVATKFGAQIDDERPGGAKPAYARSACEDSLKRLNTDVIDLYQLHRPDPDTPIGDTLAALDDLVTAGKVREIGCSNFSAAQLREAAQAVQDGAARFVSVQNHYNLMRRDDEAEVMPVVASLGMSYIPFFPLANGLLTGKYQRGEPAPHGTRLANPGPWLPPMLTDQNFDVIERLTKWVEPQGHPLVDLAFAWLAAKPGVASVIAGATSPAQVAANARAGEWVLTSEQVTELDAITAPSAA
jgi:aryl-alcohol dehydrogenase-like predicted oxidoreductase